MNNKFVKVMFDTTSGASDFIYKINLDNIDEALEEWNDFINHNGKNDRKNCNNLVIEIDKYLNSYKKTNSIYFMF